MKKASRRKDWLSISPIVASFPGRGAGLVVGVLLSAALIASPAVAVSPAPPPPEFFATAQTGAALWDLCGASSIGRVPLICSAAAALKGAYPSRLGEQR
jgi:hypothetical protein